MRSADASTAVPLSGPATTSMRMVATESASLAASTATVTVSASRPLLPVPARSPPDMSRLYAGSARCRASRRGRRDQRVAAGARRDHRVDHGADARDAAHVAGEQQADLAAIDRRAELHGPARSAELGWQR